MGPTRPFFLKYDPYLRVPFVFQVFEGLTRLSDFAHYCPYALCRRPLLIILLLLFYFNAFPELKTEVHFSIVIYLQ